MAKNRKTVWLSIVLATALALAVPARVGFAGDNGRTSESHYNSDYIYAATRSVNKMDINPALKVTLLPGAFVFDTIFLPFATFAGLFG